MVKIDCLKEKRALIAMYFCGKEKRTVSPEQVFGSWTTWWKDDYIAKNHLIYKISDGQLIHNSQDNNKDDDLLKEYNEKFQKSYQWISNYIQSHDKEDARLTVDKRRKQQLKTLKHAAKTRKQSVVMIGKGTDGLAKYLLYDKNFKRSGTYDDMLRFINTEKRRC